LPKPTAYGDLAITFAAAAVALGPACPLEQAGEEAATPGQPSRARARFWKFPRRFTLANHRLPKALTAIIQRIRNTHVFAEPTLRHFVSRRNTKNRPGCEETVEDETSLWMKEEN